MLLALALAALSPAHAADPAVDSGAAPSAAPLSVRILASDLTLSGLAVADDSKDSKDTSTDTGDDNTDESSVKSEKDSVKNEKTAKPVDDLDSKKSKHRVIKVIQKKNFMKIGRYEVGPQIGFVTNDPFLNRYILGATLDYHITEIFAAEVQLDYSPILGKSGSGTSDPDWKPLTKQILSENSVSPDISKLNGMGSVALSFSPIYGKAAVGRKIIAFDIFGAFGLGAIHTVDDYNALQVKETDPDYVSTAIEWHPTTVISGGARVAFGESVAARLEGKATSYIEAINGGTLEMKNNFILQGGVTFFFPSMK